jgi:hypothetical protein
MTRSNRLKQIYKITYPNGKIYIGSDLRGDAHYCGSPSAIYQIACDLGIEPMQVPRYPLARERILTRRGRHIKIDLPGLGLILRKEILWESATDSDTEIRKREVQLIRALESNDPTIGYNKTPKRREAGRP